MSTLSPFAVRPSIPTAPPTRGLSVVVAADRSTDAEVLALTLEAVGCAVVTTPLGPAAVDLAQLAQPDVVIVVGGPAGWEAGAKGVGDRAGWRKPFVVAIAPGTAAAPIDGVHLSLPRPVCPTVLTELVQRFRTLLAGIDGFDPAI